MHSHDLQCDATVIAVALLLVAGCSAPATPHLTRPTPVALTFLITTRDGQEMEASRVYFGPHSPSIPLSNGLLVSFDYVSQVQFTDDAGGSPLAAITLVDGTVITHAFTTDPLALEAVTPQGELAIPIMSLGAIVVNRESSPGPIPQAPPASDNLATVVLEGGERIQVSGLRFSYGCTGPCGVFNCLYGERMGYLTTSEGVMVRLSDAHQLQFAHEPAQAGLLVVIATGPRGEVTTYHAVPPAPCESSVWEIDGETALGYFRIQATAVDSIIVEASQ